MKKKIKALVIATSVAAVAGIGAVSFAAWSSTNHETATSTGANGAVSLLGFSANTATGFTGLLPYDQVASTDPSETNKTMAKITLPSVVDDGKTFDITVTSDATLGTGSKLFVCVSESAPTAAFAGAATTEWLEIDADGAVFEDLTGNGARTAYFVMVSTDTADMSATYNITFKVEEATA